MAKKTGNKMIDIPEELGIVRKKRRYRHFAKGREMLILAALVIIGICGIMYVVGNGEKEGASDDSPQVTAMEAVDENVERCVRQYLSSGKPAAILELQYAGGYLKPHPHYLVKDGDVEEIDMTSYCENFFLRNVWYMRSGSQPVIHSQTTIGKVVLENDFAWEWETDHVYFLVIYERGRQLSDFYEIEAREDSLLQRDSCYYVEKQEQGFIERVESGYLLPDGSLTSQEVFWKSIKNMFENMD